MSEFPPVFTQLDISANSVTPGATAPDPQSRHLLAESITLQQRQIELLDRQIQLLATESFGGIILSTVIASFAVAPFAAYHFHTSQQYALIANLIAIPVCNVLVMPAALAALALLPHGTGSVECVEGGLEIPNDAGTTATVIAQAAAVVYLDIQ